MSSRHPVVMVLSGLDPSGGAGVQADIQAVSAMGCHCAPLVTALTIQDSVSLSAYQTVDADLLIRQAETIFRDIPVSALKIGMLGDVSIVAAICEIMGLHPDIPVVLDPVLSAGGGGALQDGPAASDMKANLLPHVAILTPNAHEARQLSGCDDLDAAAAGLLKSGCAHVLITGGDEDDGPVVNRFYSRQAVSEVFTWPRIPGVFHGSGCTLAAAIAARIARGELPLEAVRQGQEYTQACLSRGYAVGRGQLMPDRVSRPLS